MTTVSRAAVLALASVLVATACSADGSGSSAPPRGTPGFDDIYTQALEWGECPDEPATSGAPPAPVTVECTTVRVPLDWNDPDRADRIELGVGRVAGTGSTIQGSILVNPGGPGSEGIPLAARLAANPKSASVRASYDLVGFDPRGIGTSTPVVCEDTSTDNMLNFAQCIADNELSHFMGTSSVAKDMDVIRVLLGDETLNYLGYSYGTMLGATYADLFPDLVGRMVLDSAESAQWADPVHAYDQQLAVEAALDRFLTSCTVRLLGGVDCAFDSADSFGETAERLTERPLVATDGETFDGDDLKDLMVAALYGPAERRAITMALLSTALQNDSGAIDRLIAGKGGASVGSAGSIVRCHSAPRTLDLVALADHVRQRGAETQDEVDAAITGYTSGYECSTLAETGTDIGTVFRAEGSAPIVVVGIVGDHATPYQYAEELANGLDNATLVTLEGDGHGALWRASSCIDDAVNAYFVDGSVPAAGIRCTREPGQEDIPTVEVRSTDGPAVTVGGTSTPGDRVEISDVGADVRPARYVDVTEAGTWGPTDVTTECHEFRTVAPGRSSDPVVLCLRNDG